MRRWAGPRRGSPGSLLPSPQPLSRTRERGLAQQNAGSTATNADPGTGGADGTADDDRPGVLLVHGSATEPNALAIAAGTRRALEGEDIDVLAEYYTPDWSPDKATEWTEAMLTRYLVM